VSNLNLNKSKDFSNLGGILPIYFIPVEEISYMDDIINGLVNDIHYKNSEFIPYYIDIISEKGKFSENQVSRSKFDYNISVKYSKDEILTRNILEKIDNKKLVIQVPDSNGNYRIIGSLENPVYIRSILDKGTSVSNINAYDLIIKWSSKYRSPFILNGALPPIEPTCPEIPVSIYNIKFDTDSTDIWAIFSKFTGKITDAELTNIDSYKIDGVTVGLPFTVEFNTTYLIEVVKTNPSLSASIKFSVSPTAFTDDIDLPDFSIGTGNKIYGLSNSSNCVYVLNSDLLTFANTSGIGTWIINPIIQTISLPTLPVGSKWYTLTYVTGNKIVVSADNGINSKNKYFCYIDKDDNLTDLAGNPNTYTALETGYQYGELLLNLYDYVNNIIYWSEYKYGLYFFGLNLNTNTIEIILNPICQFNYPFDRYNVRNYFNPFKELFIDYCEIDIKNAKQYNMINGSKAIGHKKGFNRKTGYYISYTNNTYSTLIELTENSKIINYYASAGASGGSDLFHININHNNNVVLMTAAWTNNYSIHRINDLNTYSWTIQYPETGVTYQNNGMFVKDNLHVLFRNGFKRLTCINDIDPVNTLHADFNYYDFPDIVDDIYVNRLL